MKQFIIFLVVALSFAQNDPPTDSTQWVDLKNSDFSKGTYLITKPGYYRLAEDIWFNPKAPTDQKDAYSSYLLDAADKVSGGGLYDDQAYQIGFWTAVSIQADHVTLDLQGHYIGQHKGHNLMNRFFNVIELGSQPFLGAQGFHSFSLDNATLPKVEYVTIRNGRIGRAATSGVHGLLNSFVLIENINFEEFEYGAIHLEGATTVTIRNVNINPSKNVAVNSYWNTVVNLRQYIDELVAKKPDYTLTVGANPIDAQSIRDSLKDYVNNVYKRVVDQNNWLNGEKGIEEISALFGNDWHRPDRNCFGIRITHADLSGTGFFLPGPTDKLQRSSDIYLSDVHVYDFECAPVETVAITGATTPIILNGIPDTREFPIIDPRGNVFSLLGFDWDWTKQNEDYTNSNATTQPWFTIKVVDDRDLGQSLYNGNAVSNGQAIVGQAILDDLFAGSSLQFSRSSFNRDILTWMAADPATPAALLSAYMKPQQSGNRPFLCSSDIMNAPLMGTYALFFTSTDQIVIEHSSIEAMHNWGYKGAGVCPYTSESRSNYRAFFPGYSGVEVRGFFFAGVNNATIHGIWAGSLVSDYGSITIFDVISESTLVTFDEVEVRNAYAGNQLNGQQPVVYENNPTRWPTAVAFHVDTTSVNVTLLPYCVNNLNAPTGQAYKTSLSNTTVDQGEWITCHVGDYPWWIWFLLAITVLIFIIALIAVIMACLDQNKTEGEHYTQMND